jgi:DNA ligase-4
VNDDGTSHITIFSKSGKESTMARYGVHDIIRQALGLPTSTAESARDRGSDLKNVVLDAEMVSYSKTRDCIDG